MGAVQSRIEFAGGLPYDKAMNYYTNSTHVFFGGPVTRTVKLLIVINVAVFVLQTLSHLAGGNFIEIYFGLIPASVTHNLAIWRLVTYMFLHGGIFHIFFNMLTLFMFGNDLERHWGTKRFINYYFVTGIGAGVCSWVVAMNSIAIVIGASGAIYGLLLAYGLLYPNRIVYLNFLLPIKVKWLVTIMGAIAFFSSVTGSEPGVANIAHLGGMLVGFLYLKGGEWAHSLNAYQDRRRRAELKRQFEVYYGELRRKIDEENDKGPTIH
jgi:membrane associated rhomboid family serine protease